MTVLPIRFFAPTAESNALAAATAAATPAAATATATVTAANGTALTTFSAVLGQLLTDLGPLAFNTTLSTIGSGNNTGVAGGLVNTVFNLLLFNSLGVGQGASSPAAQQLLLTQLLASATDTNDTTGLGALGTQQLDAALAQLQGTSNNLLTQLTNISTQPNPILFSASTLAQAFQIGNDTGSPS